MSQKRNKTVLLVSILLVAGLIIVGGIYYNKKVHVVTLDNRAFQNGFEGYGTIKRGNRLSVNIPLQLVASQYSLKDKDILCFNSSNLVQSSFRIISGEQKVESFQNNCIPYDANNTDIEMEIKGKVAIPNVSSSRRKNYVILTIYKEVRDDKTAQALRNMYFVNDKGEKEYFKNIKFGALGNAMNGALQQGLIPTDLKPIILFSIKQSTK